MARQYKRILRKVSPAKPAPEKKKKPGKDIFLLIVISFVFFVLIFGWGTFDLLNRAMYVLLLLSLCLVYAHKHADLEDSKLVWLDRLSFFSISASLALFLVICYFQYIAS